MCTQRASRTISMPQLPSIPYLIYQSIIEFASLLPPCFLPDFDSHSLRRYLPPLPRSFCAAPLPFLSFSHSFSHDAASRLLLSFACLFLFQLAASKVCHQTPPINHSLYHLSIFFLFTPPPLHCFR